mgnify:CR=1 FL=1
MAASRSTIKQIETAQVRFAHAILLIRVEDYSPGIEAKLCCIGYSGSILKHIIFCHLACSISLQAPVLGCCFLAKEVKLALTGNHINSVVPDSSSELQRTNPLLDQILASILDLFFFRPLSSKTVSPTQRQ